MSLRRGKTTKRGNKLRFERKATVGCERSDIIGGEQGRDDIIGKGSAWERTREEWWSGIKRKGKHKRKGVILGICIGKKEESAGGMTDRVQASTCSTQHT